MTFFFIINQGQKFTEKREITLVFSEKFHVLNQLGQTTQPNQKTKLTKNKANRFVGTLPSERL